MDAQELPLSTSNIAESAAVGGSAVSPSPADAPALPENPVLVIKSGRRWMGLELGDLWRHRDLFFFLAWRDVKVRYKQTALGVTWAILQPLLTMVVFTFFFGRLAKVPSDGEPYAIFSYAGLLPWNFFSSAVTNSGNSLVGNASLITKVYFPRLVIPGAAVAAALVDFILASLILLLMMAWYGVSFTPALLMFPLLTLLITLIALGTGMWMSALNVKYRDIRYALPFVLQLWMFVTPIIYPLSFVPAGWRWLLRLNPLSGAIAGFRAAIFGHPFPWSDVAISLGIALAVLVYSAYAFRRMEMQFADII
ncbi:MAG TPA: ABC transporter permease [Candidatus Binataceae bacterium]|nr:ABC transporter permease [Candidatus Binataceae bacterium]